MAKITLTKHLTILILTSIVANKFCLKPCDKYVSGMIRLIKDRSSVIDMNEENTKMILKSIWLNFDNDEDEALAWFTTIAFENTYYLKNSAYFMKRKGIRGMLNLLRDADIKAISKISGINFKKSPDYLNEYTDEVISATVALFKLLTKDIDYTGENIVRLFFNDASAGLRRNIQIETTPDRLDSLHNDITKVMSMCEH